MAQFSRWSFGVRMPEIDGVAFLEQMRQRWPDVMRDSKLTGHSRRVADLARRIALRWG